MILPETDIGGFPLVELHFAPRDSKALSNGFMGLLFRLWSPDKTVLPSDRAEMAVANLIVVPELAASMKPPSSFNSPELFTVTLSPVSFISTPKFLQALIVALVSPDFKIFLIILLPSVSVAKKIALCV
uniref:Uncharacterized protein n=1 Tax=uncultured marine thaumarchaeote KM3_32_D07 TaxID=1456123 RepID=A0A075H0W0_9ARCH|nr:hypothetical protein [uncultured marine thaumarchaeote KM3_32_D07]